MRAKKLMFECVIVFRCPYSVYGSLCVSFCNLSLNYKGSSCMLPSETERGTG